MKYFFGLCLAILVAGCAQQSTIAFTGTTPGIDDGVFMVRDIDDSLVCKADIKGGKFSVSREFTFKGYGYLSISSAKIGRVAFDIYMSPGKYIVTTNKDKPYKYPDIVATARRQNELTAYYHLTDTVADRIHQNVITLSAQLKDPKSKLLSPDVYKALQTKAQAAQQQELKINTLALDAFVTKYPGNEITPRLIIVNNAYLTDLAGYYAVYKKLSPTIKNGPDGAYVGKLLDSLNRPVK